MSDAPTFPDFETLRQQAGRLRPLVRALVGAEAANDVLQETWLRAWQRPPRAPGAADGWLRRVATRLSASHRRAEGRRQRREAAVARDTEALSPSTAETVERLAVQRAVSAAVMELAEPYRTAVLLRFYHGLSAAEVAQQTGTTAANVRQRTSRGLETMRARLGEELGSAWRRAPALLWFLPPNRAAAPMAAIPFLVTMTNVRLASVVVSGLCLLAVAVLTVPLFFEEPPAGAAGASAVHAAMGTEPPAPGSGQVEPSTVERTAQATSARPTAPASGPTLRGSVRDDRGRPVAGVEVGLSIGPNRQWQSFGVSDSAGAFAANGPLPLQPEVALLQATLGSVGTPPPLQLEVAPPWATIAVQMPASGPAASGPAAPVAMLVVAPGREQLLTVRDQSGFPVAGAKATVRVNGLVDFPDSLDLAVEIHVPATTSDEAGRHHWPLLPLSRTTITVSKPGYRPATVAIDADTAGDLPVVLERIEKGTRVVTGVVTNSRGLYVRGAIVGLGHRETRTDEFGGYVLVVEAGGRVWAGQSLFAASEGFYPAIVPGFGARLEALPEGSITQDLRLDRLASSIAGRVVDHEGAPVPGACVYPWQLDNLTDNETAEDLAVLRAGQPLSLTGNLVYAFARTDADGAFVVPGLDRREYRLRVYHQKNGWAWTSPAIVGGATAVELRLPADLQGPVAGRVRDRSGAPAVGVKIAPHLAVHANGGGVASIGLRTPAVTDGAGRFTIPRLARHGASLTFGGKEWIDQSISLDAVRDPTSLEVVMLRRCHVRVQLTAATAANAEIAFLDAAGGEVPIQEDRAGTSMITMSYRLHDGKSEVLSVSEAAATLVIRTGADGKTEEHQPVALRPGEGNLVVR